MSVADWVILGVVLAAAVAAAVVLIRGRGKGCGSCSGCPRAEQCRAVKKK